MRANLILVLVAFTLVLATSAAAASSGTASVSREKVDGFAFGVAGDCPDEPPAEPLVCTEWIITPFRSGFAEGGGGGVAPPQSVWELDMLRHTLTFPGGGGDPVESDVAFAFGVPISDVAFDQQHLSYASVHAAGVELSDGSTADVDARWEPTSSRFVYGNDGPALADFGLVRHVNNQCLTANNQGHQKFREARLDATINGVSSSHEGGFISFNQFVSIEVQKDGCA